MAASMLTDLKPKTEPERQIAQKLIDTNFRLNRLASIENNIFSFGLTENETDTDQDDRIEVMAAQTRAWIERANSFDTLGRYEARLSRQLLKFQEEFERLQTERKKQEFADRHRSPEEIEEDRFDPASFGQIANSYRILTHLPPPKPCTAGDLDHERSTMLSLVQADGPLHGGLSDSVAFSAAPVATGVLPKIPEIHMEA